MLDAEQGQWRVCAEWSGEAVVDGGRRGCGREGSSGDSGELQESQELHRAQELVRVRSRLHPSQSFRGQRRRREESVCGEGQSEAISQEDSLLHCG